MDDHTQLEEAKEIRYNSSFEVDTIVHTAWHFQVGEIEKQIEKIITQLHRHDACSSKHPLNIHATVITSRVQAIATLAKHQHLLSCYGMTYNMLISESCIGILVSVVVITATIIFRIILVGKRLVAPATPIT